MYNNDPYIATPKKDKPIINKDGSTINLNYKVTKSEVDHYSSTITEHGEKKDKYVYDISTGDLGKMERGNYTYNVKNNKIVSSVRKEQEYER